MFFLKKIIEMPKQLELQKNIQVNPLTTLYVLNQKSFKRCIIGIQSYHDSKWGVGKRVDFKRGWVITGRLPSKQGPSGFYALSFLPFNKKTEWKMSLFALQGPQRIFSSQTSCNSVTHSTWPGRVVQGHSFTLSSVLLSLDWWGFSRWHWAIWLLNFYQHIHL